MKIQRSAIVRFAVEGFHNWPNAMPPREYLVARHRHMFHYEVRVAVTHNDREIEFHDLLAFCKDNCMNGEMGGASCEDMAEDLIKKITLRFPGRKVIVKVFEDGEVGARLQTS